MIFFAKNKILVTHDGTFHADDLFATAALSLFNKENVKVIRSRSTKFIDKADYVYDVGGEYDPSRNRFDHHQKGGAGVRENGIPYAAFGLVWKTYGEKICGSKEVADIIEEKLVSYIDANDNGINLFDLKGEVAPYTLTDIIFLFRPSWKEEQDYDKAFIDLLPIAVKIISREIIKTKDELEAHSFVIADYEASTDKRVIFVKGNYPWRDTMDKYTESLYVISEKNNLWRAEAVSKEKYSFELRKPFPESWAGKRDGELAQITGVADALFCHNGRFLVVAKSKEGIMALVEKALIS